MANETATPVTNFKIKQHVTLPQLKLEVDKPFYLRFDAAIFDAEKTTVTRQRRPKLDKDGKPLPVAERKMAPPMLAKVTNHVNGKQYHIIVNTVLASILDEHYADDKYVGKSFQIIMHQLAGKDYKTFDVAEIEVDATAPAKGKR